MKTTKRTPEEESEKGGSYPAPVIQSAEVVLATSRLQAEAARMQRLRIMARTHRDVAWLLSEYERLMKKSEHD